MSRAVDILINGVDNFSKTAEDAEKSGQQLAKELDSAFNKVALAVLGATTALEVMNREQRGMRETLERTAYFLDTNSESLRELAVNIANVTRPTSDVVKGFRALMQRGIQNEEHLARLAIQYDTLADAMGENMLPVLEQVIPMFAAFGDNAGGVERYGDKLVHTFEATSLELADFNRVMRRSRIYLTNMGLTMDDAIAVLYGLGESSKNSAQAMYTLQRAARRADGDFDKFLEIAGLTKEELGEYKEILEDTEGTMNDFADIHADSYTPIQKLLSIVERLKLRYGETIETLGSLMTVIGVVVGGIWVLSTLTNSLATNVWLAHKAFVALAGLMSTSLAVVLGWTAGIIALVGGFTYLAETMTDDIAVMERSMERLEGTIDSVSKIIAGELGDSWESIADVPEQVIDQWEDNIKKGLDIDVDIRENFDTFESLKSFLEQGVADLEIEIMNTDDVGGVISQAITSGLEKVKPAVYNAINGLEEWLFDSLEAMDFEAFDGKMGELLDGLGIETTLTVGLTVEDIDKILSEVERKLKNVDEQLEAGLLGSQFEVLQGYAEATKSGLEELLNGGLEPTSEEVQKLFNDFVEFTSQMNNGAEKAEYMNEAFIGLLDSGITPNTKGYDKLKQAVIAANNAIDNSEPDEQIKKRDEIIKAYQQEIQNIEMLADKKEELGQEYDEEGEKLKVYENALKQLMPLYGVSEQQIEKLMSSIEELTEEEETLVQSMQKARTEIALLTKLDNELGDSLDLTSDRTSTAQSAIDKLTEAWIAGDITIEEFKKEVKYFNDILDSPKVDSYADSIEELNTQLRNINEMEKVGVLDEAEADQRRLNNVNRQMELMVNNQEHINEETGKVTQEFKNLLLEAELLEESLGKSEGQTKEMEHGWRRVLDVISNNVSAVGAFRDMMANMNDVGFSLSDIKLPEGMDLGINFGGIGEKVGNVFSDISSKLGSFIGEAGVFLSVIMPMLEQSKHFDKVMGTLARIMEPVVEIFGLILEALYPYIRVIEMVLVPLLKLQAMILETLILPVFKALFPVIKLFGVVILSVGELIANVVGIFSHRAREVADEMGKARRDLMDLSWDDLQDELKDTESGMSKVNEELHNIPSGFKLNLERFRATAEEIPERLSSSSTVSSLSSSDASSNRVSAQSIQSETNDNRQTNHYYYYTFEDVDIMSDDPEEVWRELKRIMKRENYEKTGTTLRRDNRYA